MGGAGCSEAPPALYDDFLAYELVQQQQPVPVPRMPPKTKAALDTPPSAGTKWDPIDNDDLRGDRVDKPIRFDLDY